MKKKLTPDLARKVVLARITKGDAFMLTSEQYQAKQREVCEVLAKMSLEDIKLKYPHFTYDFK